MSAPSPETERRLVQEAAYRICKATCKTSASDVRTPRLKACCTMWADYIPHARAALRLELGEPTPMPKPRLHRPPPKIGPQTAPVIPTETVYPDGRISWPDVFMYHWANGIYSPFPPRLHVDSERAPSEKRGVLDSNGKLKMDGEMAKTWPYKYVISDLAGFDALQRSLRIADPLHTGAQSEPNSGDDGKAPSTPAPAASPAAAAGPSATNEGS